MLGSESSMRLMLLACRQSIRSLAMSAKHGRPARLGFEFSRALGFEGMGCVHPLQIPVIHEAFAPTAAEIWKSARKIVAAYNEAQEKGLGVVSLGSKMIDPPVVQRALKIMARAKAMGLVAIGSSMSRLQKLLWQSSRRLK